QSCTGKDSFVNALFDQELIKISEKDYSNTETNIDLSESIYHIKEQLVSIRIKVMKIKTFGRSFIFSIESKKPSKVLKKCMVEYLENQICPSKREDVFDERVHLVVYFVRPDPVGLTELDIETLKGISSSSDSSKVTSNVVIVIGRSDSIPFDENLPEEKQQITKIKEKIRSQIEKHGIIAVELILDEKNQFSTEVKPCLPAAVVTNKCAASKNTPNDFNIVRKLLFENLANLAVATNDNHYQKFKKSFLSKFIDISDDDNRDTSLYSLFEGENTETSNSKNEKVHAQTNVEEVKEKYQEALNKLQNKNTKELTKLKQMLEEKQKETPTNIRETLKSDKKKKKSMIFHKK
ncbi:MAG: septin, partial [Paramarteilia canceri]